MTKQTEKLPRLPKLPPLEPIGVMIDGELLTTRGQLIDGFGRAMIRDIEALLADGEIYSKQWIESCGLLVGRVRMDDGWRLVQRWTPTSEPEPLDPGLVIEHLTPILALLLPDLLLTRLNERAEPS